MNGDTLIANARRILRDTESATQKGEEWRDEEIVLALNASQDVFVNHCIKNKYWEFISPLLVTTALKSAYPVNMLTDADFIASPFLYYASAYVTSGIRLARFYWGGELDTFLHVNHSLAGIISDSLYFRDNGAPADGVLVYYKKPSFIGATSLGHDISKPDFDVIDFEEYVYNDIILEQAVVILGIKETQTQRDFKKKGRTLTEFLTYPQGIARYVADNETPAQINQQKQLMMQKVASG